MSNERAGGSLRDPVILPDNDDDDSGQSLRDREFDELRRQLLNFQPGEYISLIEDNEVDEEVEVEDEDMIKEIGDIIDLTIDDEPALVRELRRSRRRLPETQAPERQHQKVPNGQYFIKTNKLYELDPELTLPAACQLDFILVSSIIENLDTHEFTVVGLPLCRSRRLMGKLPKKLNEVFALYEIEEDDNRSTEIKARIRVPISAVGRPRSLHTTNAPFPAHRYVAAHYSAPTKNEAVAKVKSEGPLVCRWRYTICYQDQAKRRIRKPYQCTLERVRADEVNRIEHREQEETLREQWRGETTLGGNHGSADQPEVFGPQAFTVFDAFCGAGGFSRGAERAGFKVKYAIDHWNRACDTYKLNFTNTRLFEMPVDELVCSQHRIDVRADHLHLSPPCQPYSPAHTIPGRNDPANVAALFACRNLIDMVRPRTFTLEQTFGIVRPAFEAIFSILVSGFTDFDYSITWRVVDLQTWGLPAKRSRLIMIGACPGEKLPPFPRATHHKDGLGGLQKFVTARQALSKITKHSSNHEPEKSRAILPNGSIVCQPDDIMPRAMTCSGGQNMHWDFRPFTPREFACLQGFPVWHRFAGQHCLKKQIGNAFPPCAVRLLCDHLKNWLLEVDGLAAQRAPRPSLRNSELIFLSEGPRLLVQPLALPPLHVDGGSLRNPIRLSIEDGQIEIKFDFDSDTEMGDVSDVPDSPRSATMSLPSSPEPPLAGCFEGCPIMID